jgi:hypothetical protein
MQGLSARKTHVLRTVDSKKSRSEFGFFINSVRAIFRAFLCRVALNLER